MNHKAAYSTLFAIFLILVVIPIPFGAGAYEGYTPISHQDDSSATITRELSQRRSWDPRELNIFPTGKNPFLLQRQPTATELFLAILNRRRVGSPKIRNLGFSFASKGMVTFELPRGKCSTEPLDANVPDYVQGCEYEVEIRHSLNGEVVRTDEGLSTFARTVFLDFTDEDNVDIDTVWVRARARAKLAMHDHDHPIAALFSNTSIYYTEWSSWTSQYRVDYDSERGFIAINIGTAGAPNFDALHKQRLAELDTKQRRLNYIEGDITIRVVSKTYNSVTLSWELPEGVTATSYDVRRQDRAADGHFSYSPIRTGSAATTYTVTNLSPNTLYGFSVKAHGAEEDGSEARGFRTFSPWTDVWTEITPRHIIEERERAAREAERLAREEEARREAEAAERRRKAEERRLTEQQERAEQAYEDMRPARIENAKEHFKAQMITPYSAELQKKVLRMASCQTLDQMKTRTGRSKQTSRDFHETVIPGVAEDLGHPEWLEDLDCTTYDDGYDLIYLIESETKINFFTGEPLPEPPPLSSE